MTDAEGPIVRLGLEDAVSPGVDKANAKLEEFEQNAQSAHQKYTSWADQSTSATKRVIASLERMNQTQGRGETEKLVFQREALLQRWAKEPAAVDAVTKTYERLIATAQKVEKEASLAKMAKENEEALKKQSEAIKGYGENITQFMENPLQGASGALGSVIGAMGPWGAAIGAGVGILTGFAAASIEATKSLAEYGLRIKDVELRTGLTVKEVGEFSFAAKAVGQDIGLVERIMRGLSQAESDNSKEGARAKQALKDMGVELRDSNGEMKSTKEALEAIAEGLSRIPAGAQRDAEAIAIFKRAGIEAIPMMEELTENIKRFDELGGGGNQADIDKWAKYNVQIAEADTIWDRMMRKIKSGIAGTIWLDIKVTGATWVMSLIDLVGGPSAGIEKNISNVATGTREDIPGTAFVGPHQGLYNPGLFTTPREGRAAAYAAYEAGLGLPGQLKQEESVLSKMTKPSPTSSEAEIAAYAAEEKKIEGIKTLIENAKHAGTALKELENKVKAFELSLNERELSPSEKIFAQANAITAKPGTAHYGRVTNAATAAAGNLSDIEEAKIDDQWAKTQGALRFAHEKEAEATTKALEKELDDHAKHVIKDFEDNVKTVQNAAREKDRLTIDSMNLDIRHQGRMSAISAKGEGPAAELDALNQELGVRKEIRDMEFAIKDAHSYLYKMDDERQKNELENLKDRYEMEEKIAEVQQKEFETLKSSAEKLVEVLFTKPKNFAKDLGSVLHQAVLKPAVDAVSSGAAHLLQPLIYGANGQGGISGMFHPNQDPVKVSTDQNTGATLQNSIAIMMLTAHLAAGMGTAAPSMPPGPAGSPSISVPSISAPASFGNGGGISFSGGSFDPLGILSGSGGGWSGGNASPRAGGGGFGFGGSGRGGFNLGGIFNGLGGGASSAFSTNDIGSDGLPVSSVRSFNPLGGGGAHNPFSGTLASLKNTFSKGNWMNSDVAASAGGGFGGSLAGALSSKGGAQAEMAAGMPLTMAGLTGIHMGSGTGIAEGTVGGALTGAGIGTMIAPGIGTAIGAGVGAAAGAAIGGAEMLLGIQSPQEKVVADAKSIYGISLPLNSGTVKQIVSLAQSQYGNNIAVAMRSPSVRQLLMLYSEATGQKTTLSASTPYAGSLVEQGGGLFQQATYQDGAAHQYASNIPTLGGIGGSQYPTQAGPNTQNGTGLSFALNINGTPITSQYVMDQSMAAQDASYGRTQQAANLQLPGLMIA